MDVLTSLGGSCPPHVPASTSREDRYQSKPCAFQPGRFSRFCLLVITWDSNGWNTSSNNMLSSQKNTYIVVEKSWIQQSTNINKYVKPPPSCFLFKFFLFQGKTTPNSPPDWGGWTSGCLDAFFPNTAPHLQQILRTPLAAAPEILPYNACIVYVYLHEWLNSYGKCR